MKTEWKIIIRKLWNIIKKSKGVTAKDLSRIIESVDVTLSLRRLESTQQHKTPFRGEVWTVNFGYDGLRGENIKSRPALILQNDMGNAFSGSTLVVPISSSSKKRNPAQVYLSVPSFNGSLIEGTASLSALQTVSKVRLGEKIGEVDAATLASIEKAAMVAIGIGQKPFDRERFSLSREQRKLQPLQ